MKKKILSLMVIAILLGFFVCQVVSALSFTASITPSSTTVAEATEFTVTIKVSNLDVGSNGITALSGYLKYDTDVFETINDTSIEGLNSWNPTYDASTGKISLTKNKFVSTSQEVLKIAFKTKSGVTGETGSIKMESIIADNSETEIPATDISTTITVGEISASNENTTSTESSTSSTVTITPTTNTSTTNTSTTNATINNTINSIIANNTTTNNTTNNTATNNAIANEAVPYTGVDDTICGALIVVIAIALVFYFKIEKINRELN